MDCSNINFALIIGIFLLFSSCSKKAIPDQCKFSEKPVVDWSDFKGKPKSNDDLKYEAAISYCIRYEHEAKSENGVLVIYMNVFSGFSRSLSWYKGKEHPNEKILEHEEFHFLIAELHARSFKKMLAEYPLTLDFKDQISTQFDFAAEDMQKMQKQYDQETNHSENTNEQKKWQEMIMDSLISLDAYKAEKYTINTGYPVTQQELNFSNVINGF